jgi:hypothetical protein
MQNLSNPQFSTGNRIPGATNMPNKVTPGTPKTPLGPKTPGFTNMPNKIGPSGPKQPLGPKTPGYTTMPNKPPSGITKPGGILNNPSVKKMNG